MKQSEKIFISYEAIARTWIGFLDRYTEEQFLRKPSDESWSLGQLYNHLFNSAILFHLKQIETCADGKGTVMSGGKTAKGKLSYFIGGFPPIRIKVPPSPQYTPAQPVDKNDVKGKLLEAIRILDAARTKVDSASPNVKTSHPAFGYLNAKEWYQMILMHYRHHLHQKKRLDEFLSTTH
jgi:hypothetical protein